MRLRIADFAKISNAELEFDGLTVIVGKNNSGKSTVGKVLYALFRSLSQLDRRVFRDRVETVQKRINQLTPWNVDFETAEKLVKGEMSVADLQEVGRVPTLSFPGMDSTRRIVPVYQLSEVTKIVDIAKEAKFEAIAATLITRVMECVFHHQYKPLLSEVETSRLELTVRGEANTITINRDVSTVFNPTALTKKVRFIASPDVLSLLNVRDIATNSAYRDCFEKYTLELAQELVGDDKLTAVEYGEMQSKLAAVLRLLDEVISGEFKLDESGSMALYEKGHAKPTKAENLSMGIKSFVLLRHMLRKGVLQDKDILILDEPENHLHPTLQVVYAKILVLLQREFELTVLLTSHSTFFVNAVKRFARMLLKPNVAHFYLSQEDAARPGFVTFVDKTQESGPIFRSFNEAYAKLDELSNGGELSCED